MASDTMTYAVDIGPLKAFQDAARYHLTLRKSADNSSYLKVLLFRLASMENTNTEDTFTCMQAECPHLGADLSNAPIDDFEDTKVLLCPWHQYDFDLKSGESSTGMSACTFPVVVQDGHLCINFTENYKLVGLRPVSEAFAPSSLTHEIGELSLDEKEPITLTDWGSLILRTADPAKKVALTRKAVGLFRDGKIKQIGKTQPPDEPPRPARLNIIEPGKTLRRGKGGSERSRISLLHSLANIEQWAIDLAIDIICRFPTFNGKQMPLAFFSDFLKVAEDEAKQLEHLNSSFGALPVHNGLWQSAKDTSDSLMARLCIIHLVHESRGLDVNPTQIARFREAGDMDSVESLTTIHNDEVTHVMAGHRWLVWLCEQTGEDPVTVFRDTVKANFYGSLKPPFNEVDRARAGLSPAFYVDLEGKQSMDYTKPLTLATAGG